MSDRIDVDVPGRTDNLVEEIEKMKADLATAHVAIATARFRLEGDRQSIALVLELDGRRSD